MTGDMQQSGQGTMIGMLRASAERTPSATALELADGSASISYADLLARAENVSAGLADAGLTRGDSLALWLPNGIEWVVLEFAAASLGVLVVPLNTRYKVHEVAHLLGVGRVRALVLMPEFHGIDFGGMAREAVDVAAKDGHQVEMIATLGAELGADFGHDQLRRLRVEDLERARRAPGFEERGEPEDLVNVFGTSGTTSFPKLASHVQGVIVRHAHNAARAALITRSERSLGHLPFCGTFGFVPLTATLAVGGCVVVLPVYTHEAAVEAIEKRGVTYLATTEAIVRGILGVEGLTSGALRTWERGIVGGTSVTELVVAAGRHGVALTNVYGSSEVFGLMAMWQPDEDVSVRATAGGRLVGADMHVRAVDPETGETVTEGEIGELQFGGFNVTRGYLANDAANEKAFTTDGWYRSGDRGRVLQDGRAFEYHSRLADTLRLRGYLVSPAEIEEFLVSHPAVDDAYVVGLPDPTTGEDRAFAFVRPLPGRELDPAEAAAYCRENLAAWKVPEAFFVREELPTTPSANGDKVQKNRLREIAAEAVGAEGR